MIKDQQAHIYKDGRGWEYKVVGGIGGNTYKGRYKKPRTLSWKCMRALPWRKTQKEAEKDLAEYAKEKGWIRYDYR